MPQELLASSERTLTRPAGFYIALVALHHHPSPTMISMHGVPSSLIARNESWVRKQAASLARRLPSNVERADLIQVGLIAVAQSALAFRWEGDTDTEEAKEAFARYARVRVKGAMLDELRQMDHLGRAERRKVKAIQIARERWRAGHDANPSLAQLSAICGVSVKEISRLEQAALIGQTESLSDDELEDRPPSAQPSTPQDEVEARVDTGLLLRRLEKFFAGLPERERQVIDAYLGVGMTPVQLAGSLNISASRVSQMYKTVCRRIAVHLGHAELRAVDRLGADTSEHFDELVALREAELARSTELAPWGKVVEEALTLPTERFEAVDRNGARAPGVTARGEAVMDGDRIVVDSTTRWG